jgi:phosphoenolpyruvate---glycerone phosphotransferase subunit DhaL
VSLDAAAFRAALTVAADQVRGARDELCRLDAAAGDGDLGATLEAGFAAVREQVEQSDSDDVGAVLKDVAMLLARTAPGTIGTLLATAFLRAAKPLDGKGALDGADVATLFETAASGVAERGKAEAGQRTVLDAMFPSAEAARAAADSGADVAATLAAAAKAAHEGAEATAEMEPQLGRAGWIGQRAKGLPDAGATAWAVFAEGLSGGVAHTPRA